MKNKSKIIFTILAFATMLLSTITVNAVDYEKNGRASEQAGRIQSLLRLGNSCEKVNDASHFYGGMYINDQDVLVVQIVKENIPKKGTKNYSLYKNVINKSVIIEYVKYSHAELCSVNSEMETKIQSTNYNGFYHYGIDGMNNTIEVGLRNLNDEEIAKFKSEVIDSPLINLVQGYPIYLTRGKATDNDLSNDIKKPNENDRKEPKKIKLETVYIVSGIAIAGIASAVFIKIKKRSKKN